jgi:hypothetical protein
MMLSDHGPAKDLEAVQRWMRQQAMPVSFVFAFVPRTVSYSVKERARRERLGLQKDKVRGKIILRAMSSGAGSEYRGFAMKALFNTQHQQQYDHHRLTLS